MGGGGGLGRKKQQLFIYLQAVGWCLALGSPAGRGNNVIDGQEEGKKKCDSLKIILVKVTFIHEQR